MENQNLPQRECTPDDIEIIVMPAETIIIEAQRRGNSEDALRARYFLAGEAALPPQSYEVMNLKRVNERLYNAKKRDAARKRYSRAAERAKKGKPPKRRR